MPRRRPHRPWMTPAGHCPVTDGWATGCPLTDRAATDRAVIGPLSRIPRCSSPEAPSKHPLTYVRLDHHRRPRWVPDDVDVDVFDPPNALQYGAGVVRDVAAERAGGRRHAEYQRNSRQIELDVVHQAQVDDVDADFRVDDILQALGHVKAAHAGFSRRFLQRAWRCGRASRWALAPGIRN